MKAISTAQHSSVISLLNGGYSLCQIQDRTGLGKYTVERISKEVLEDKENCPRGCPSKLSSCDQHSIIWQIRSRRLDNAVQVTQFINSTITTPVTPQTVLKKSGFYSATKKKVPMLKKTHRQKRLEFAHYHENWTVEVFKRVLWSDEMKINWIGSDGKVYVWKERGEPISDRTTTPTVKHGGGNNLMVWGCMGWNGVELPVKSPFMYVSQNMSQEDRMHQLTIYSSRISMDNSAFDVPFCIQSLGEGSTHHSHSS